MGREHSRVTIYQDLLVVQEHDTTADQLRHRRQSLPELAQLAAVEDDLVRLEASLTATADGAADAARSQRHLEAQLAVVESKVVEIEARLYSGAITVPRELQAMQSEGDILRSRRTALEDEVLEAMARRETLDEEIADLQRRRSDLDDEGVRLRVAVAQAETEVDQALSAERTARESAASSIPGDLSTLYEQLRVRLGGVAAAMLVNGRCGGCHLALPATELARLRKASSEELVRCEQCERILVRP